MGVHTLSPQEALDLFRGNDGAVYIDVRTVAEFAAGHPRARVVNIPILFHHPVTTETYPNSSFLEVVAWLYAKDALLVIGADEGQRARQAAVQLQGAGYTDIWIMPEGIGSWRRQKLPTTTDNRDGISYASLLTALRRKGKKRKAGAHAQDLLSSK